MAGISDTYIWGQGLSTAATLLLQQLTIYCGTLGWCGYALLSDGLGYGYEIQSHETTYGADLGYPKATYLCRLNSRSDSTEKNCEAAVHQLVLNLRYQHRLQVMHLLAHGRLWLGNT